jgi:HPt (histidine-containing phosphotransfer) domain-containing protein
MSTETPTTENVLDLATAMTNMDGDVELLQEIMEIFMETAEEQLQSIENCILIQDVGQVATQAHGMKGGASNFCAGKFVASALKLEQLAKAGSLEGAQELLQAMRQDFQEVREVSQFINWEEVESNWDG